MIETTKLSGGRGSRNPGEHLIMTPPYPAAWAIEAPIPTGEDWGIGRGTARCRALVLVSPS